MFEKKDKLVNVNLRITYVKLKKINKRVYQGKSKELQLNFYRKEFKLSKSYYKIINFLNNKIIFENSVFN